MPCQVVVRVVDKVNPDNPRKNIRLSKRGDVITVVPIDAVFPEADRINPDWRILVLPNVGLAAASAYLADYPGDDLGRPYRWRRSKFLDVDFSSLPGPLKAYLADSSRAEPSYTLNASAATIAGFFADRPDPGPDPNTIG